MTTTHAPSEAAIQATMQELAAATRAQDTTALVACFAEEAVLEGVGGTYRGNAAIARAFDWLWEMLPMLEYRDVGMGMRPTSSTTTRRSPGMCRCSTSGHCCGRGPTR